ncbi:CHAT domain-containing protein [Cellulomonas fimi]|uniref:CHAT domain-containing protein n=1 Tax=Cellulomonas fimi TaxID=1708 RepID=A0A7Y0LVK5_CELFI|nr:CHAT domain-containing protein [Cellulomonas fimi]NMR18865.1 CHAT domain-containing protein [Cellulomonas fimi]
MRSSPESSELDALTLQVELAAGENADGRPAPAARRLRPALVRLDALGRGADVGRVRARAVLELAKSDFEMRADASAQLERLDHLAADGAGWPGLEPAVAGLRGLLHLRAGDVESSLRELDTAVDQIDSAEVIDACCALLNRGVLHLERGDLARARRDLAECVRRSKEADLGLLVFKASHNLGYLEYLAGRLPLSLARMEEASQNDPGGPRAIALLDRARVLVEAGLVGVADATLAEAAAIFAADRLPHDLAEAELARAECALLRADHAAAQRFAAAARRRFERRGDEAWAVRATVLELQVQAAALTREGEAVSTSGSNGTRDLSVRLVPAPDELPPALRTAWRRLATRCAQLELACADTGRTQWAYVARMLRTEAEVTVGSGADARSRLVALGAVPAGAPLGVRLQGQRLRAELALRAGDRARAARHVRAGQRDLAAHRARFGSIDLRTASAVHGAALAEIDLRMALASGRADVVLDAAERSRAVIRGARRVNPPPDAGTAALLAELRQLLEQSRELDRRPATDPQRERARREALRLRHAIQARSWQEGDTGPADEPGRARELVAMLGAHPGTTVVSVLEHRGHLAAVRLTQRGAQLVPLGPAGPLREQARRAHADLPVVANPLVPAGLRAAAEGSLQRALGRIDDALCDAVAAPGELVVVVGGWLAAVPWSMLRSRVGRPTVVAPSARHWLTHAVPPGRRPVGVPGLAEQRLSAVAGPGLQHARLEVEQVALGWPDSVVLTGPAATCAEVAGVLRAPGVVHLAAHGRHETDNPLFSSVRMADGPLFAHELDNGSAAPELVLLSSCEVGRTSVRPGGEALGLASVLLRIGVGAVVAAIAPLSDDVALRVMTRTHALLRDGWDVARALAQATQVDAGRGAPAPLVCFGASV